MSDNSISIDSGENLVQTQMGGKKRRNGHKYSCKCPICINMKHAKRGGDNDELADYSEDEEVGSQIAGRKKKRNGHKPSCRCPICKNMRKKGGDIETDEDNMKDDMKDNVIDALDEEYDNLEEDKSFISGGTKKRKTRKTRRNKKTRRNRRYSHRRRR